MTMADTVAVMNRGAIEQMGAPEELYELPKTAFVATFLGQSNLLTGEVGESTATTIAVDIAGRRIVVPTSRARAASALAPAPTSGAVSSSSDVPSSQLVTGLSPGNDTSKFPPNTVVATANDKAAARCPAGASASAVEVPGTASGVAESMAGAESMAAVGA